MAEVAPDPRTLVQRQHDFFTGLITAGLRSTDTGPGSMRPTAQITAVITLQDLKDGKGVGMVAGIEDPLSTAIRRLVEENGYATVVGPAAEPVPDPAKATTSSPTPTANPPKSTTPPSSAPSTTPCSPGSHFEMRMIRGKPHLLAPPWIDPEQKWIPLGTSRITRLTTLRKAGW